MYLATNVFSLVNPAAATDLLDLARVVEELGFDEIDLGDHVTIGRPSPGRPMPNPPAAALLEPLVALGALSAVTRRIRLGTGVLILPQRLISIPLSERYRNQKAQAQDCPSPHRLQGSRIRVGSVSSGMI